MFLKILCFICISLSLQASQTNIFSSHNIPPVIAAPAPTQPVYRLTQQALQEHQLTLDNLYVHPGISIIAGLQNTPEYQNALSSHTTADLSIQKQQKSTKNSNLREAIINAWIDREEKTFIDRAQSYGFLFTQYEIHQVVATYRRPHQSPSSVISLSSASENVQDNLSDYQNEAFAERCHRFAIRYEPSTGNIKTMGFVPLQNLGYPLK